jgi:hypothetical protein
MEPTGNYTLKVSGTMPTYVAGVSHDLTTDYTNYLSISHDGSEIIAVSWDTWGDFYVSSVSQGWIVSISWTDQTLTIVLNGTVGQSGTITVYCGSRGSPQKISGFSAIPEYNAENTTLSGTYTFQIMIYVTITLDFAKETASVGGITPAVTFTVGKTVFQALQGETVEATLNFTWVGVNQLEIVNMKFTGAAADWLTLADLLPKAVTKQVGDREGYGEVQIRVKIPKDADLGDYTVPTQVDVEAVGNRLTSSGWITFTIIPPPPPAPTQIPDYMTYLFAALLLVLVAYAYLKR